MLSVHIHMRACRCCAHALTQKFFSRSSCDAARWIPARRAHSQCAHTCMHAQVLCACTESKDKVVPVLLPDGSQPGERISVAGFDQAPVDEVGGSELLVSLLSCACISCNVSFTTSLNWGALMIGHTCEWSVIHVNGKCEGTCESLGHTCAWDTLECSFTHMNGTREGTCECSVIHVNGLERGLLVGVHKENSCLALAALFPGQSEEEDFRAPVPRHED